MHNMDKKMQILLEMEIQGGNELHVINLLLVMNNKTEKKWNYYA